MITFSLSGENQVHLEDPEVVGFLADQVVYAEKRLTLN